MANILSKSGILGHKSDIFKAIVALQMPQKSHKFLKKQLKTLDFDIKTPKKS